MKIPRSLTGTTKTVFSTLVFGVILLAPTMSQASVSQTPLSLTEGVPPNIVFTLDDSTSMAYAYVPDSLSANTNHLRFRAASFNPMYYDPQTTYRIPKSFDSNGNEVTLSTSFTAAYIDGYNPSNGTRDLSSNYSVTHNYNTPGGTHNTSSTPSKTNLFSCTTSSVSNNNSASCNIYADSYTAQRSNSSCTITSPSNSGMTCTVNGSSTNRTMTLTKATNNPAYYSVLNTSNTSCLNDKGNDNCYRVVTVSSSSGSLTRPNAESADERQNFAIWYSFYRTRALATLSAASLAFFDLAPSSRLTWQSLINCKSLNSDASGCGKNKLKEYNNSHRAAFIYWLQKQTKFTLAQGTQLRNAMIRAGDFYSSETPWNKYPNASGNTTDNTYACRASYHVVMTDGLWNSNNNQEKPATPSPHDNQSITLPDGKTYNKQRPYADTTAASNKTVSDYAMQYWASDLRPNLSNKLKPYIPYKSGDDTTDYWDPRNNPASWQHMVNYMMGLGLTQALNQTNIPWEGETFKGAGYERLVSGTADWPAAADGSNNNVYDLWHAAINSRGEFFSADSPDAMVNSFEKIFGRINERSSVASRPAVTSGLVELTNDTGQNSSQLVRHFYQTSYASNKNWSGDLVKFTRTFNAADNTYDVKEIWSAQNKLANQSPTQRNIKIPSTTGSKLQNFTWANAGNKSTTGTLAYYLSTSPEATSDNGTYGEARLNYLRGDRSNEGSASTQFRSRSAVLGDLFSSTPAVVAGSRYREAFVNSLEGNTKYTDYINATRNRSPRIYVGANDGMLHAFHGDTGAETFAFIPTAVFPTLNKLTGKNYVHQFYVDGSPIVSEVYDKDAGTWKTILIGTLRAGGKGLFALDITTPGSEKLLWEFGPNDVTADKVKPGYSFPKPTVARLHNGRWAVVTGNGYEAEGNTNGKAALYIIDAITGALSSLEVSGTENQTNGLSTPKLADNDGDGIADYAYAGDLQGNLWRFDLYGSQAGKSGAQSFYGNKNDTAAFAVSYGGAPLFKASTDTLKKSITAAPTLVRHPSNKGYIVVFGTGKYFDTVDAQPETSFANTLYGIWDKETLGSSVSKPSSGVMVTNSSTNILTQEILSQTTASLNAAGADTRNARFISETTPDWSKHNGWKLDLRVKGQALDGEMLIEDMSTVGQTLFFQSLTPNKDPCANGNITWTYAINPHSGARTLHHVYDHRTFINNVANSSVISGIGQPGEGGFTISSTAPGQFELCTGDNCVTIYSGADEGRQSWRLVPLP